MKDFIKTIISCLIRENHIKSYHIYGTKAQIKLNNDKIINISLYEQKYGYIATKNRRK